MSIKVRLRFSYIAMLVIPFILILALTHIYTSLLEGSTKYSIGAKGPVDKLDFYTQVVASTNRMMKFVNNQSIQNSDKFLDNDFLESLENNRQLEYTGLVIRKNEDIVYVSEEIKTNLDTSKLPRFNLEEVTTEELYEEKNKLL